MTTPLVTQQIEDFVVVENDDNTTLDLANNFDDPSTTGQIARFDFADNIGVEDIDVLLFDQEGVGAPNSVANFIDYVEAGDYENSIIHRSVPEFIIQGGGFTVVDEQVVDIPANDPVDNEFSPERSNVRGTIALAKLGENPDSATNQWFFNLADNSENLDNQNGGFTAFGEIINEPGLESIDAIADLDIINGGGALSNVPVTDLTEPIDTEDLVFLDSVSLVSQAELSFSVTDNSNEELIDASVVDGELILNYTDDLTGEATITVEATNLLGESIEDAFVVTVEEPEPEPETPVDEQPTEEPEPETPVDEQPTEEPEPETPVDEQPTEEPEPETPVDEQPTEEPEPETPVDEQPTEEPEPETPVDEQPTEEPEETPVSETPVDEVSDADPIGAEVFRFLDPDTGIRFYVDSEEERAELRSSQPDLIAEDLGYRTVDPLTGAGAEAEEVFSLLNQDTGAFLYTTFERELDFIEENLDNYVLQEDSFFAFTEQQPNTIPIYRFLDTDTGAHFYTPSEIERESIEDSSPDYNFEGVAFYAFEAAE